MAGENENGQEKTEQPSEKRLRESREQGQTAQSKELATAAIFGTAIAALWFLGDSMGAKAADWMRAALDLSVLKGGGGNALADRAFYLLASLMLAVAPLILLSVLAAFVAPMVMGGVHFSAKALTPDFSKLSPAKGLARMYGREAVAEFLRALLRIALISGLAAVALWQILLPLMMLVQLPLPAAVSDGAHLVLRALAIMCAGLVLLALVDVPYQLWSHSQNLMMTREEVKQEFKESEGSPEVKGRIRQLQKKLSEGRMLEKVPAADAILVNPTHYAVAIQYDAATMAAPRVVAKGVDQIAFAIRQVAEAHQVPIVSTPPLARALYRKVQIGGEIPMALYAAVAEVLGYVYQLKAPGRSGPPPVLPELTVPDGDL